MTDKNQAAVFENSKVVDSSGDLMKLYHGSKHDFSQFSLDCCSDESYFGAGIYFTADRDLAATYAGNKWGQDSEGHIYEVVLNLKNPYKTGMPLIYRQEFDGMSAAEIRDNLIKQGYDGVMEVFWTGELYDQSNVIAFYPEQIKILDHKTPTIETHLEKPTLTAQIHLAQATASGNRSPSQNQRIPERDV